MCKGNLRSQAEARTPSARVRNSMLFERGLDDFGLNEVSRVGLDDEPSDSRARQFQFMFARLC